MRGPALQCLAVVAQSGAVDAVAAEHQRAAAAVADDLDGPDAAAALQRLRDRVQPRLTSLHQQHLRARRQIGEQALVVWHPRVDHQQG